MGSQGGSRACPRAVLPYFQPYCRCALELLVSRNHVLLKRPRVTAGVHNRSLRGEQGTRSRGLRPRSAQLNPFAAAIIAVSLV